MLSNEAIDSKIAWVGLEAGTRRWEVALKAVEVIDPESGAKMVSSDILKGASDCRAHLDTGATYSEVPPSLRARIVAILKAHDKTGACSLSPAGDYTCRIKPNEINLWPTLKFDFGSKSTFDLPAEHYFEIANGNPDNSTTFRNTLQVCRL